MELVSKLRLIVIKKEIAVDNKNIWIDDTRNPNHFLSPNEAANVLWLKNIRPAITYVSEHSKEIEVLYLDYYMDDNFLFGSEFVYQVLYDGRKEYPLLKTIYLHSSDDDVIDDLMQHQEEFNEIGIDLIIAPYRRD